MIKLAFMINKLPGLTTEQFVVHHRDHHGPLFSSIPEARFVRKYTVSHPVAAPGYPAASYDGLTEIWFDSWADHDSYFTSSNYRDAVNPDESTFIDMGSVAIMVTEETQVI